MSLIGREIVVPANVVRPIAPTPAARDAFLTSSTRFGGAGPLAMAHKQQKRFSGHDTLRPKHARIATKLRSVSGSSGDFPADDPDTETSFGEVDNSDAPSAGSILAPSGPRTVPPAPHAKPPTSTTVLATLGVVVLLAIVATKVL